MVDRVSGDSGGMGPLSPEDKKAYESEYREGLDLLKRTVNDYDHSNNMFQRAEYKDVMNKAVQVLKESSSALQKKALLDQTSRLEKDLAAFESQESPTTLAQLKKDLNSAH